MVDTTIHSDQTTDNNHVPFFRVYANSTARLADSTLVAGDLLKVAYQTSDDTMWILTALTPTWVGFYPTGAANGLGSMYMYEATKTITINATDEYHGVEGFGAGTQISGTTFLASANGVITSTANNGGVLRCTDAGHGLTTGQYIALNGMGDALHVGTTRVTVIDASTFDCDDIAYNSAADTGFWQRGSSISIDSGFGGTYVITFSMSILSVANNKNYKFEMVKNTTDLDEFAAERKIAIQNDLGNMGASGIVSLAAGDVIWQKVENRTDSSNLVIEHANVHMFKL